MSLLIPYDAAGYAGERDCVTRKVGEGTCTLGPLPTSLRYEMSALTLLLVSYLGSGSCTS